MHVEPITLITRWIHIAFAIVALGGAAYVRFALIPAVRDAGEDASILRLLESARRKWSRWVHASVAMLFITGGLNFYFLALQPRIKPMPYHALFGIKFLLAIMVFFLAEALVGRSAGLAKFRARKAMWLAVILILGAVIIGLSGVMQQVRLGLPLPTG